MKNLTLFSKKNAKTTITTTALITVLTMSAILVALPAARAQYPELELTVKTWLYVIVAPNPVGRGQTVFVNVFFSKPALTAGFRGTGVLYENVTVEITSPTGERRIFGPYRSDAVGGFHFEWTPQEVGEYSIKAIYPGQYAETLIFPFMGAPTLYKITYLPSESPVVKLIVQEAPVEPIYKTPPLPTEYWTRPIYAHNWKWAQLGGSWFGLAAPAFATTGMYDATGNFNPYTKAPKTAHIVWTKPTHFGGQPGLPITPDKSSQYMSTTIATSFFEPIILNGILYYTEFAGPTAIENRWIAVDVRTGETLWTRSAGESGREVFRMGQILRYHSIQEYGCWAFLYACPSAAFFGQPSFFAIYDPFTGAFIANITGVQNVPFLMDLEENQGDILGYYISGGNLTLWSSLKLMMSKSFDQITIRPRGTYNWSDGIVWSVPVPKTIGGAPIDPPFRIAARTPEVILLESKPTPGIFLEANYGYHIVAGVSAKNGSLLWGPINRTLPYLHDVSILAARDGVYVMHDKDTDEAYGFSLENGQKLWGPVKLPGNALSHISRAADIAYGKVYIWDYGGYVNALDLKTGKLLWTFTRGSAGYDTPYGVYSLWEFGTHSIADGILFLSEGKMYDPPMYPARRLAINCTDGSLVWSILSFSGRCPGAIADGYLVEWNSADCQIYVFGKGPTETSVTVSPKVSALHDAVLIEGTVMDTSPGARQEGVIERFPKGLPAVADENMTAWMEYVYMQQPRPENVKGVWVTLDAVSEKGECIHIGGTHTDDSGFFSVTWIPPHEGAYKIIATFPGSESYWPSHAETSLGVTAAPPPTATAEQAGALQEQTGALQSAIEALSPLITALIVIVVACICLVAYDIYINRKMLKQAAK